MPTTVELAISQQNPYDAEILFPTDLEGFEQNKLTVSEYLEYFNELENLLTKRNAKADSFTLKFATKECLEALNIYLTKNPDLRFKELKLELETAEGSGVLPEIVKLAADKGLASFDLSKSTLSSTTASQILKTVQDSSLCMDIVLPNNDETQQLLDDNISNFQRSKRIELYGQEVSEAKKEKPKSTIKRKRKILNNKKFEIDTEVQVQVAVELSHEVEIGREEQYEDKSTSDLIDRTEFIKQTKSNKFKTQVSDADKKRIGSIWDDWLGNIQLFSIEPRSFAQIKLIVGPPGAEKKAFADFHKSFNVKDDDLLFFHLVQPSPDATPTDVYLGSFYGSFKPTEEYEQFYQFSGYAPRGAVLEKLSKALATTMIQTFHPEITDFSYPTIDLSIQDYKKFKAASFVPRSDLRYSDEGWKGQYLVDASTLEAPNEATLESLVKTCPIKFKRTQFLKYVYPNTKVSKMTKAACEVLLEYQSQLRFGLDFEHLPAGFELKTFQENGESVTVLNFSKTKARIGKDDPFAIKLVKPDKLPALSAKEMQVWLDLPATKGSKLKNIYDSVLKSYKRDDLKLFRELLPVLLYLPNSALTSFEDAIFALQKQDLDTKDAKLEDHLLYHYLDEEGKNIVRGMGKLSAAELNKILAVHSQFGLKGLKRLDEVLKQAILVLPEDKFDDSLLKDLKENYFPNCKTFLPCLDPNFEKSLIIIKNLSKSERYIWDDLFKKHCAAVGYDDFPNLVQSFQAFKKTITEKYRLPFPSNPKISEIRSLPVALSRIIAILDATPERDRAATLESVFELYLHSNGAIKVLSDNELRPEGGILAIPEMQMEPKFYFTEHDKLSIRKNEWSPADKVLDHGYHALNITHTDPDETKPSFFTLEYFADEDLTRCSSELMVYSKSMDELKRNYYRFLSAKPYRQSLGFYKEAAKLIDNKFSNQIMRGVFYSFVSTATSSLESSLNEDSEAELLEKVKKIITVFDDCHLPEGAKLLILDEMAGTFIPAPPLDYLVKIFSLIQPTLNLGLSDLTPVNMEKKLEKIQNALNDIRWSNNKTNSYAFYDGIRFFDYENINYDEFCKLCDVSRKIAMYLPMQNFTFVSLISTFNLNESFREEVQPLKNESQLLEDCLKILVHINPGKPSALKQKDLLDFMTVINLAHGKDPNLKLSDEPILDLIKEKFSTYFAPDFFEKLTQKELPKELIANIQSNFHDSKEENFIKSLLKLFGNVAEKELREPLIKILVKVTSNLKEDERKTFIEYLATLNASKQESLQDMTNLLLLIGERRSVHDFILLMKQATTKPSLKFLCRYFKDALPLIYQKLYGTLKISELQTLIAQLLGYIKDESKFVKEAGKVLNILAEITTKHPNEKSLLLTIVSNFMTQGPGLDVKAFAKYLMMEDGQVLRSLCTHYADKPIELSTIFIRIQTFNPVQQKQVLKMLTLLANNKKPTSNKALLEFISLATSDPALFKQTMHCFDTPPYLELETILSEYKNNNLGEAYLKFQMQPALRENDNAFTKDKALPFTLLFKGADFEETELNQLENAIKFAQTKDINTLKDLLSKAGSDHIARLSILAELLYRSKAINKDEPKKIKANSFELIQVQYLTILKYLKSGGHITAEMATGEGKSRTMMMAIACLASQGKTVDFVTSDMQLAARDYLEYQAFFKMIGVESSLIYSTSTPESYKKGGINFSDASNLSLFRNIARASGKKLFDGTPVADLVIDKNPNNRALVLDEADKTYFDISETRFNFSDLPKASSSKDMTWIYPLLIKFFTQDKARAKIIFDFYKNDIDACNDAFFDFVQAQEGVTDEMFASLQELPNSQIETWHESAITAINLKQGEDYTIEPNVVVETAKGPILASEARLIYGSRVAPNSKFSFGVHQCLHAYLNQKQNQTPLSTSDSKPLSFFVEPEKQIVYSSTSKSLLDEYKQGEVWGITGTAGAIIEREEAALVNASSRGHSPLMEFFTAPRVKGLKRVDKPLHLTKNFDKRMEAILEYILEAHKTERPVLVIAESDIEAQKISDALKKLAGDKIPEDKWRFVDALTSTKEESSIIEEAGKFGVTISTKRLGRGTDIELSKELKETGGLRVIGTFLPRIRDLEQIFGRAGRYGAAGDAMLIVDKSQLKTSFKSKSLKSDFFLSTEFFVKSEQAKEDKRQQIERLIRQVLSDFRVSITDKFFKFYDEKGTNLSDWSTCTKEIDQLWAKTQIELQELLAKPKLDVAKVNAKLAEFRSDSQKFWSILNAKVGGGLSDIDEIELSPITEHLIRNQTPKRLYTVEDRTQVYKAYEKALDGRAVIYDDIFVGYKSWKSGKRELFANTKASLAGTGIVFADTRALLAGKKPLFANLRAWMAKSKQAKKELQLECKSILKALEAHNLKDLKQLLRTEDARSLVTNTSFALTMKIELVEVILSFIHKKAKLSNEAMGAVKEVLDGINDSKNIEDVRKLPVGNRFFSASVKREFKEIIAHEVKDLKR